MIRNLKVKLSSKIRKEYDIEILENDIIINIPQRIRIELSEITNIMNGKYDVTIYTKHGHINLFKYKISTMAYLYNSSFIFRNIN